MDADGQLHLAGLEPDPPHLCHAEKCRRKVPEKLLMCPPHWAMVPAPMRTRLWAVYRPGQEITKTPTVEYLDVAHEIIRYVARVEGHLV